MKDAVIAFHPLARAELTEAPITLKIILRLSLTALLKESTTVFESSVFIRNPVPKSKRPFVAVLFSDTGIH